MSGNASERKNFVLDTSVLIYSPTSLHSFDDNTVIIPVSVIDCLKNDSQQRGEIGANARECCRILDNLCNAGESLKSGVPLKNGGILKVSSMNDVFDVVEKEKVILVTRDAAQRVRANVRGLRAEEYKTEQVATDDSQYYGRSVVYVSEVEMNGFAKEGALALGSAKRYITSENGNVKPDNYSLSRNEFVTLVNLSNPDGATLLGRYNGQRIVKLNHLKANPYGVKPRNAGQIFAIEALMASPEESPLVILKGAAGTAKTFLAMAAGLELVCKKGQFKRILVSRPNTKFDDDIGYLKGDEMDKIGPMIRPVLDNMENLMPNSVKGKGGSVPMSPTDELFARGIVTAQAMAFMRGRSICDTFIVIDEAQNATANQILGLITRVGVGSKIILLGDPNQIDHPYLDSRDNGLSFASERMRGSPLCWQVTFDDSECTRSELASEAITRLMPKGA